MSKTFKKNELQKVFNILQYSEEGIQNYSPTVLFCGTPYI